MSGQLPVFAFTLLAAGRIMRFGLFGLIDKLKMGTYRKKT
jgi:hypothetical protein